VVCDQVATWIDAQLVSQIVANESNTSSASARSTGLVQCPRDIG